MPLTHRVDNQSQACTFQKRMASPQKDMELQRRNRGAPGNRRRRSVKLDLWTTTLESRVHVQTVGLNDKKISSAFSNEEIFFLTCPFIGSLRTTSSLNIGYVLMIFGRLFRLHPLHLCLLVRRFSGYVRKFATRVTRLVTVLTENPSVRPHRVFVRDSSPNVLLS